MSNYNLTQLESKDMTELKKIATELELKVSNSAQQQQLVYDILDRQAVVNSQLKAAKEKNDPAKAKRSRVALKKNTDKKVMTVNGKNTAKVDEPQKKTSPEEKVKKVAPKAKKAAADTPVADSKEVDNKKKVETPTKPKSTKKPVAKKTTEVAKKTTEVAKKTTEVAKKSPEVAKKAIEPSVKTDKVDKVVKEPIIAKPIKKSDLPESGDVSDTPAETAGSTTNTLTATIASEKNVESTNDSAPQTETAPSTSVSHHSHKNIHPQNNNRPKFNPQKLENNMILMGY